ncbi:MAG: carboxypeptidase regulatory-like domain-containing protein [Oceanicaulis sp.]
MFKKLAYGASVAALAALAPVAAVHAQQTDATVRGSVVDANGAPIAGATITFLDTRTNAVATATTSETGNFARPGLRVGGPYTVTVTAPGFQPQQATINGLAIGTNPDLDLELAPAGTGDVIVVQGQRIGNALEIQNGVGTTFTSEDLQDLPLLDRDLTNIINLDPLVSVEGSEGESGVVSFAGIEPRLNGFTVDGAVIADRFKLEEAFYPTLRQPISFDVIEAVAATYSEYSVLTTGAQGGLVNTVTKSGSNEIDGAAFYRYGDDNLQGSETEFGPLPGEADFEEKEWGVTVSGPIIEDTLFFLASYEEYEQVNPDLYDLSAADLAVFANIRNIFQTEPRFGGFDPGEKTNVIDDTRTSERFFGKLDWQINDAHRASVWYTNIQEQRLQNRGSYEFAFPTSAYDKTTDIDMYLGTLQSDWTDNLSTTLRIVRKEQVVGQTPRVSLTNGVADFGTFIIDAGLADDVEAGSDPFRHANAFEDEETELFASADYVWNDHLITVGAQYLDYGLYNLFGQFCRGEFEFGSIADLQAGNADVSYQNTPTNDCQDRVADWGYKRLDLFVQDEWQISPTLSINYGLRYERFMTDDEAPIQGNFAAEYGADSAGNLDGLDILLPRFGFNWDAPYDTTVQGGFGLFSGGDPVVWFSNAYSPIPTIASGSVTGYSDFSQIPTALQNQVALNTGPFSYDHISPDFNIPSLWKASIRAERFFDFGPLGEDYLIGAQIVYSTVKDSAAFINRAQLASEILDPALAATVAANTGVAPDGRPIYSDARSTGDAIQLINSDEGESFTASISIEKEFDFGLTLYGAYAYTDSERLIPGSSSRHISNYRSLVTTDRNSASPAGTSVFEVEDRFVFTAKYERDFFRDLETQVVLRGTIESGPVSNVGYVHFSNSGFSRIFGRAAGGSPFSGVDMLYVPTLNAAGTGFDDPLVVFSSPSVETAFFNAAQELGILENAGGTVEKNGLRGPWNQRFDLSFTQELPGIPGAERFVGENRLMFEVDIFNVANLLNSDWGGQIRDPNFDTISLIRPALVTTADANAFRAGTLTNISSAFIPSSAAGATCQVASDCVYVYDAVFGGDKFDTDLNNSVWQVRLGLRYEF